MAPCVLARLVVSACFAATPHAVAEAELGAYRRLDLLPAEPNAVTAEWRDSWDATLDASRARWAKELAATGQDASTRDARMGLRTAWLLEGMLERFEPTADQRIAAYRRIAAGYGLIRTLSLECSFSGRACFFLRRLAEEFPGRADLAAEGLAGILDRAGSVDRSAAWTDYATTRLIALHGAGYIEADHPALARAWRARATMLRTRHRLAEADRALERARELGGGGAWYDLERAELSLAAGRWGEALKRFRAVEPNCPEEHASRVRYLVAKLSEPQELDAPDYPRDLPQEVQWLAIRGREGAQPDVIHALIQAAADGKAAIEPGAGADVSVWCDVDRALRRQPAGLLAALRRVQAAGAADAVSAAARSGDRQALFRAWRRHPWSAAVHEAMLAAAERMLRAGRAGLALRTFEDVRSHSADPSLRARARVGLWLAAAADGFSAGELRERFAAVADDLPLPWMGATARAGRIKQRILASLAIGPRAGGQAAERPVRILRVPPAGAERGGVSAARYQLPALLASGHCRIRCGSGKAVVCGPNLLACYGADANRPLWVRAGRQPTVDRKEDHLPRVFPPYEAAIDERRVYARWGLDPTGRGLSGLAAFDAETGRMLWAADRGLYAVGNPAAADGRVYVFSLATELEPYSDVYLTCLDAATGRAVWRTRVVSREVRLWGLESNERGSRASATRFHAALAVHRGAVYCQSNLGFVARHDARDGLLEWRVAYPRAHLERIGGRVVYRRSPGPFCAGGAVVFAPQDFAGAFALDAETGRRLWGRAFVPSEDAAGLAGGAVVLHDGHALAAVDASSGAVRWLRHFAEPIEAQASSAGGRVCLAAGQTLHQLDAATGRSLAETAFAPGEAVAATAVRADEVLALPGGPARMRAGGQPRPEARPLRLPLSRCWRLKRTAPELLVPPAEAKLPGRVFIRSNNVLECLQATPSGGVEWQRPLPPRLLATEWLEGTILLVYPWRVVALDARSGAARWDTRLPFRIDAHLLRPPRLIVQTAATPWSERVFAALDLATGKLLWRRRLSDPYPYLGVRQMVCGERNVHLFGRFKIGSEETGIRLEIRPEDGRLVALRRFPANEAHLAKVVALGEGFGFYMTDEGAIHEIRYEGGPARFFRRVDPTDLRRREARFEVRGDWLHVRFPGRQGDSSMVLKRGDPSFTWEGPAGELHGDRLFHVDRQAVTAVNLRTGKPVKFALGAPPDGDRRGGSRRVLRYALAGPRVVVLSAEPADGFGSWTYRLRVDLFDRATGERLGGQRLDGVSYSARSWGRNFESYNGLAVAGGLAIVSDPEGLAAFGSGGEVPAAPRVRVAHRMSGPVALDGRLEEWGGQPEHRLAGEAGGVRVAHDARNVYLAVTVRAERVAPRTGFGREGGGDWLEIGLTGDRYSFRWGVGVDVRGRVVLSDFGHEMPERRRDDRDLPAPPGTGAGVRYDLARRQISYELAIPKGETLGGDGRDELGVSVAAWREAPGGGQERTLRWGEGLPGDAVRPAGHEIVRLHALSPAGQAAATALVDALPDLDETVLLYREDARTRCLSAADRAERYWAFVRRHPASAAVPRFLALIRRLRGTGSVDAADAILARAAEAGVPKAVRDRFRARPAEWEAAVRAPISPPAGFDPVRAAALLRRHIPALGPTDQAARMLERLLALDAGDDPARRIAAYQWFLHAVPDHPQAAPMLVAMLNLYEKAGSPDPVAAVDAFLQHSRLPEGAVYAYNRRWAHPGSEPILTWQVLGPFPGAGAAALDTPYAPETEGVALGRPVDLPTGEERSWQLTAGQRREVSLDDFADHATAAVVYAVCWARSDRPQPAVLELRTDGACKAWINRKLVRTGGGRGEDLHRVRVQLPAGASEILLKLVQPANHRAWKFSAELVEARGRGPLKHVRFGPHPPAAKP